MMFAGANLTKLLLHSENRSIQNPVTEFPSASYGTGFQHFLENVITHYYFNTPVSIQVISSNLESVVYIYIYTFIYMYISTSVYQGGNKEK